MKDYRAELKKFTAEVKKIQNERIAIRKDKTLQPGRLGSVVKSVHTQNLFAAMASYIQKDIERYESVEIEGEIETEKTDQIIAPASLPSSQFTASLSRIMSPYFINEERELEEGAKLSDPEFRLFQITRVEVQKFSDNLAEFGSSGLGTLQKMRKSEGYLKDANIGGCLRLLKAAKTSDPHNNTLAYIISQVSYFQAFNGHTDALPNARGEASKSASITELVDSQAQLRYKYDAICCERGFSDKKPLEWLQEFYLLDAEQTSGQAGLSKNDAIYFKSWLILSTLPSAGWGDYIFSAIDSLANNTVGGAAIYLHLFRDKVVKEIADRPVPPEEMLDLERKLSITYASYLEVVGHINDKWKKVFHSASWTTRNRFISDFLACAPVPTFDEVLLNIALNGRSYEQRAFPINELLEKGYERENYWRLWAIVLNPDLANRVSSLLPVAETALEYNLYTEAAELLEILRIDESAQINKEKWEEAKPFMPIFTVDHIVAAGCGNPNPRSKFSPTTPPFSNYYRAWRKEVRGNPLPSEIITEAARLGAFASSQELLAGFEGAFLLVHDGNYGLKISQKNALKAANKKPEKFSLFGGDTGEDMDIMQMVLYVFLPIAVVSALIFVFFIN